MRVWCLNGHVESLVPANAPVELAEEEETIIPLPELIGGDEPVETEEIQSVVSVRPEDDGAGWLQQDVVSVSGQTATEEGGAQVDCDGGEPDHEEGKHDALTAVPKHKAEVLLLLLCQNGRVVDDGGQQANCRDCGQTEDGRLQD